MNVTAAEYFEEFVELTRSTAECDVGPEVMLRPGLLTVRYDVETDSGPAWTSLRFGGAIALRVVPEPAVSPLASGAYSKVGTIKNSEWLASLLAASGDGKLPQDLKHFVVFFDHFGSVETVARSCEVQACEVQA